MPANNYLPIANGTLADVESQAQYALDLGVGGSLENGYTTGVAQTQQFNKTVRQSSVMTSAVAQLGVDTLAEDFLDDGDVPALEVKLRRMIQALAIAQAWTTGDVKVTAKTVADSGWVLCNDGSIGNAASGGTTRANADTQALFTLLWTNFANGQCPTQDNAGAPVARGVSAAADYGNNRRIVLPLMLGRAIGVYGAGSGLTARALGFTTGTETVTLDLTMIPGHNHTGTSGGQSADHTHSGNTGGQSADHSHTISDLQVFGPPGGGTGFYFTNPVGGPQSAVTGGASVDHSHTFTSGGVSAGHTHTIPTEGGGLAHSNMQPTSFLNAMIKL